MELYQCEREALLEELEALCLRETNLVDSMIKLRPKTLVGIAAVAAMFKADQAHFWKKPEADRDREISLLTRFLDGLIDLGQAPSLADRVLAEEGEART
jgi:hypothetical protein